MNGLVIVVVVVLAGYAILGRKRGFIRTVFTLFSTIIALMLTMWISPIISKEVVKNEKIYGYVMDRVEVIIDFSHVGRTLTEQVEFVDQLPLPKSIRTTLLENNNSEVYVAMAVDSFEDYVCGTIANIMINAGVFVLIMLIVTITLAILSEVLNIISKLPIINGINKTAGLLVGLLHGFIIVWVGCIVILVFGTTSIGQYLLALINESEFLGVIYNNNILLQVITNIGALLF